MRGSITSLNCDETIPMECIISVICEIMNACIDADHEMSDLEEVLDEALQLDFNVQAEDDSPYMVSALAALRISL